MSTALELADEQFRLLVESMQDYAIYLLDPNGVVRSWNAGAQLLKGYASSEIIGRNFAQFFSQVDRDGEKPQRLLAAARRDGRIEDVGWRVRRDGSQFWANAIISALRDRNGTHIGFAKITRDLTDRGYRSFVEASHAIVWTTDAHGRPSGDSPSWRAFTGQSESDWRARRTWDAVHPEDLDALTRLWSEAMATGTALEAQFRLRRRSGDYAWVEARAIPFFDAEGRPREWFAVAQDISARKHAELATQRALEMWATTLRSIGDAVISTDGGGHVRFMNPIAERLTGWTAHEAAGRTLHEVFPIFNEETGAPVENPVEKVLQHGAIVGLANHTILRNRTGVAIPIDDSAAPIRDPDGTIEGVVLVFRDASEQKREILRRAFLAKATEELLDADDHREALNRVALLAVPRLADWVSVDLVEPGSVHISQVALAHVDPARIELARELARRYPPDPNRPTGVANVLRTGRSELYRELPGELLDGGAVDDEHRRMIRELDLRSALVVPLRAKGPVFGAITFIFAGSDRRYTERDLELAEELARRTSLFIERRRLEEEAELANRMKDEFLATMSHELRTPLQAILGYATMLERGTSRAPAKAVAAIMRNVTAQTRLIEDILDVSRITSGKLRLTMSNVNLASAVLAALEALRPAAEARSIQLINELPADLGQVYGDFDRLQQIVWNLVSNAVKFTPPGGTVRVRGERTGSTACLVVEDTGNGIPEDKLGMIFERFRQLDGSTTREHGGLGLGLAIVRYLIEAHGGTVRAESAGPGSGATFIVSLPIDADVLLRARTKTAESQPLVPGGPLRGVRVVLVDDDPDARELLADLLTDSGAVVSSAASAAEGFERLQAEAPHVLVSDIGMPHEDGYSFLRRVRRLPPERGGGVPAIALTAYARSEDARAALDAGFQLHLVKPVRPEQLVAAIGTFAEPRSHQAT